MTLLGPTKQTNQAPLTIRGATVTDAGAVFAVAELDGHPAPTGEVLVAAVGDEIWAALSVDDFRAVADPFRPSGDLILLLAERARAIRRARRPRSPLRVRVARRLSGAR